MGNLSAIRLGGNMKSYYLAAENIIARCDGGRNLDDPGVVVSDHNIS
jgi:hypothetical protein